MNAVLEYGAAGCMLFSTDCPGAYARAHTKQEAMAKLPSDISAFCRWAGCPAPPSMLVKVEQEVYQPELHVETETCSLTANVSP